MHIESVNEHWLKEEKGREEKSQEEMASYLFTIKSGEGYVAICTTTFVIVPYA